MSVQACFGFTSGIGSRGRIAGFVIFLTLANQVIACHRLMLFMCKMLPTLFLIRPTSTKMKIKVFHQVSSFKDTMLILISEQTPTVK